MKKQINFKEITIREKLSSRGGGIEISLDTLGFRGEKMSAYQNYLGGGMLGSIQSDNTINAYGRKITDKQQEKLNNISEQLKKYFYSLMIDDTDEAEYEFIQSLPSSAY